MASCFLHSSHTNDIEEGISNVGSSVSLSVSLPSATCPILAATEMSLFLSAGAFHVGLSFLLERQIDGTAASTRVL